MGNYREFLFSKASQVVYGTEYNQVSFKMREENRDILFSFYEVILQENESWEQVRERVYPALVRYLKYKGFHPEFGTGCVVSLFFRDTFYLIEGPHFLAAFREIEGLSPSAFHSRVKEWLSGNPLTALLTSPLRTGPFRNGQE